MAIDKEVVRAASPLEDVIPELAGETLSRAAGRERRIRCPFHDDRDPSLYINLEKQEWCCRSCGVGGDVFTFVELHKHLNYSDATTWLERRACLSNGNGHGPATRAVRAVDRPQPARWPPLNMLRFFDYPQPNGLLVRKARFDVERSTDKMRWFHSHDHGQTWFYKLGCEDPGLYDKGEEFDL